MNILVIDHECHRKTKSADFFFDLLRTEHSVEVHYYEKHYSCKVPKEKVEWADIVVFWEFLPSRFRIGIEGKPCVFVPMYDNEWASYWQWKRIAWSGMGVVSFCGKVTEHARRCGVQNILDVRYFPHLEDFPQNAGDPKRVFLWERGEIDLSIVKKLFPSEAGYVYDVKGAYEFLDRNEYLERISKCGIVIAPRRKEGIGMAFLEAMAMGKCVVAHNDATMNEYIKDGENGILFDVVNPCQIKLTEVENIKDNNIRFSVLEFSRRWREHKNAILDFISDTDRRYPLESPWRLKSLFMFALYLIEGICCKLVN